MYILRRCDEERASVLGVYDDLDRAKAAVEIGRIAYCANWQHKQWIDCDTKACYRDMWLCCTSNDSMYPEVVIFTIEKVVLNPHISNFQIEFYWNGQPQLPEE